MIKIKVLTILFTKLKILLSLITVVFDGSEEDPEVVDKNFDIKLLGTFPLFPQMLYLNADFESICFHQDDINPDELFIYMKLRDIKSKTKTYEFIYAVDFIINNIKYGVSVQVLPTEVSSNLAGTKNEVGNNYIDWSIPAGENCGIDAKMTQECILIGNPSLKIGGYE